MFPQQRDKLALSRVFDQGSKRPHNSVLENHVKPLRNLVGLNIGIMNAILEAVLLRHNLHNAQHALCDLVFACGNDKLARLPYLG